MRFLNIPLFSLGLILASNLAAADECDFYAEKSAELQCAADGYLEAFGYKNCRYFLNYAEQFSAPGQAILQSIRSCLINSLATAPDLSCANVESLAVEQHVGCYVESGFCHLNATDRLKVYWYIRDSLHDPAFRTAGYEIRRQCDFILFKR